MPEDVTKFVAYFRRTWEGRSKFDPSIESEDKELRDYLVIDSQRQAILSHLKDRPIGTRR